MIIRMQPRPGSQKECINYAPFGFLCRRHNGWWTSYLYPSIFYRRQKHVEVTCVDGLPATWYNVSIKPTFPHTSECSSETSLRYASYSSHLFLYSNRLKKIFRLYNSYQGTYISELYWWEGVILQFVILFDGCRLRYSCWDVTGYHRDP
jgi:hypothetical protein